MTYEETIILAAGVPQIITHNLGGAAPLIEAFEQLSGKRIGSVNVETLSPSQIQLTSLVNITLRVKLVL